ncbi:hypothetical protein [Sphingobium sp. WCS2017Hpa-17]|uniref:hypothetical protein n=1 Tax=Sphingobium sp. WCS2017Hpa-17 TaxID=3073638 RepID=UPI00288A2BE8|nr:hypothetical protein [Sphingobium sp. WCS2017Hpa-17]
MWKAILFRRPLRRHEDRTEKIAPPRKAAPIMDGPFADLMEKLDRIPYRRQWKRASHH